MNNKGFTLVEILAAVTVLAILTGLAIAGYSRYIDYSKNKAYTNMAKSASVAAEEFVMDNPGIATETKKVTENGKTKYVIKDDSAYGVSFQELVEEGYLSGAADPNKKGSQCKGYVRVGLVKSDEENGLDQYIYEVDECCSTHHGRYKYLVSKKGDSVQSVEEVDTSMDREAICPSHSFFIIEYSGACEEGSGGGGNILKSTEKRITDNMVASYHDKVPSSVGERKTEYFFEDGMNFLDWTRSKHGSSYVNEEMAYYGYSESERSYVQEIAAYELNSLLTGCYPEGCPYAGYQDQCELINIPDKIEIRRNRDCYSFGYGIGTYGYYNLQ